MHHWPDRNVGFSPGSSSIHANPPVVPVSLLEPHVPNTFPGRIVAIPPPLHVAGLPEFEVQSVLDSRLRRATLYYFVDWVTYDVSERTWEPADNHTNAQSAIEAFHTKFPLKPRYPV